MMKMTRKNLNNIRRRFQEETGVDLDRKPGMPIGKLCVLMAAIVCCVSMLALGYPLFSSLDGDELSLRGTYEGNGIVSVHVENRSGKILKFQPNTKLIRWTTGQEVSRLSGKAVFSNVEFSAHSEGTMTIDLSGIYDVEALENSPTNGEWYYLVLTNNEFLFGQDWMCSVSFGTELPEETPVSATSPSLTAETEILESVEKDLRFYFEASYADTLMAFNEANFRYQQKVDEMITRFDNTVIPSQSPLFMVGGASEFLDPEPIMKQIPADVIFDPTVPKEQQYLLTGSGWGYTDGYGRMVATAQEKAWIQTAMLPQHPGQTDGGAELPLIFLFVYDVKQVIPENYAFIYGRFLSFAEMESRKILSDEHYAVYDATDLIYTDVDAYLEDYLASRKDVYCDDSVRQRVRNIREFYNNPENIRSLYGYLQMP